jgi:hypothetical protein
MTSILTWLDTSTLAVFIRESTWGFPTIESIHVIAISLVIGTIAIVDLRLLESLIERFLKQVSQVFMPRVFECRTTS